MSLFIPVTNTDLLAQYTDADPAALSKIPGTPLVIIFYLLLFNGVFRLSECLYALTYIRNRKVEYRALLEGLSYYLKALAVFLIQTLAISFWSFFFIIPGIVTALNFSQSFYIFADDPDKRVSQILLESKMMMYGNRMSYVRLIIYYVPYFLLAYAPALLISDMAARSSMGTTGVFMFALIADIPLFIAYGLFSLGRTVFYELMNNKGFADFRYAGQEAFRELEKEQ